MKPRQDESEAPTFVFGMMLGFIAGSITAFWMAPRSGASTRHEIRQRVQIVLERVQGHDRLTASVEPDQPPVGRKHIM